MNYSDRQHTMNAIQVGSVIEGRYKVTAFLGEGGFASVFQGIDVEIEREVAIKAFNPLVTVRDPVQREMLLERFRMEARTAAKIHHPNVVIIHDIGVTESLLQPYIVMELLHGHDLEKEFQRYGPMSPRRALPLVCECLEALGEGHQLGIVHKDLKPSNLFLTDPHTHRESLRIVDFGIAHLGKKNKKTARLTASGQLLGTPQYYAPEYVRKQIVTPALDVYQMGLILVEMLTGRKAVGSEDPYACLTRHCEGDLDIPPKLLSGELGPILRRALMIDHRKRYPNAHAFCDELTWINPKQLPSFSRSDKRRNPNDPFGEKGPITFSREMPASPPALDDVRSGGTRELSAPEGAALLKKRGLKVGGTLSIDPKSNTPEQREVRRSLRDRALDEFNRPRGGTFGLPIESDDDNDRYHEYDDKHRSSSPSRRLRSPESNAQRGRSSGHTRMREARRRRRRDEHRDNREERGRGRVETPPPVPRSSRYDADSAEIERHRHDEDRDDYDRDDYDRDYDRDYSPSERSARRHDEERDHRSSSKSRRKRKSATPEPHNTPEGPINIEALLGPERRPEGRPPTAVINIAEPGAATPDPKPKAMDLGAGINLDKAHNQLRQAVPPEIDEDDDEELFEYDYDIGFSGQDVASSTPTGTDDIDEELFEYDYDIGNAPAKPTHSDEDVIIDLGGHVRPSSEQGPSTISLDVGSSGSQTMVLNLGDRIIEPSTISLPIRGGLSPAITGEIVIDLPDAPASEEPAPKPRASTTIVLEVGLDRDIEFMEDEETDAEDDAHETDDDQGAGAVLPVAMHSPDMADAPMDSGDPDPEPKPVKTSRWPVAVVLLAIMFGAALVVAFAVPDVARALWGDPQPADAPQETTVAAVPGEGDDPNTPPNTKNDAQPQHDPSKIPAEQNDAVADTTAPATTAVAEDDPLLAAVAKEDTADNAVNVEGSPEHGSVPAKEDKPSAGAGVIQVNVVPVPNDAEVFTQSGQFLGKGTVTLTFIPGVLDLLKIRIDHKDYVRKTTTIRPHHGPEIRLFLKTQDEVEAERRRKSRKDQSKNGLRIAQ